MTLLLIPNDLFLTSIAVYFRACHEMSFCTSVFSLEHLKMVRLTKPIITLSFLVKIYVKLSEILENTATTYYFNI